ncbi:MAG: hypothetical protein HY291_05065 [Planctomycetes bacterium]|nr:hypothetical protein [Planctomycetota bacterium]
MRAWAGFPALPMIRRSRLVSSVPHFSSIGSSQKNNRKKTAISLEEAKNHLKNATRSVIRTSLNS